jgi:radical SAM protein with 4Fe4S-binding SPASM domain
MCEKSLVLRPSLRLYPTSKGVIFYDRDPYQVEVRHVLKPSAAVVLAVFNGKRTVDEIISMGSRIFYSKTGNVGVQIAQLIDDSKGDLLVESDNTNTRWLSLRPSVSRLPDLLYRLDGGLAFGRAAFPYSVVYIVTNRCYRKCLYCYANASPTAEDGRWLSLKRVKELVNEMGELGTSIINFTGGDPFIREDMVDIAILTLEQGIFPWISTKARISHSIARQLSDAGLPLVQVSIDSDDSELQDYLCQTKGSYDDIVSTLEAFLSNGIPVYSNTVVTSINIERVPKLVEWLMSMGVKQCILSPYARSLGRHSDTLFAKRDQWVSLLDWYRRLGSDKRSVQLRYDQGLSSSLGINNINNELNLKKEKTPISHNACTGGREGFAILPDGRVSLCERLAYLAPVGVVGSVADHSIEEVWNSEELLRMVYPPRHLFKGTVCERCPEFDACSEMGGRCYVRSWLAYGTLFAPDPLCPKAPKTDIRVI